MAKQELKTDRPVFVAVWERLKNFEIRKNDRGYAVGDILVLRETVHSGDEMAASAPLEYTGRTVTVKVTYILQGPIYGLMPGWAILSFEELSRSEG